MATLEFVASAGRDEALTEALAARIRVLVSAFEGVAARSRAADDPLTVEQLASLLTAFDQGAVLMMLAGWEGLDGAALQAGVQCLLRPVEGEAINGDGGDQPS